MNTVATIVLAAGASSRLGQAKQLIVHEGETLLERAVRIAVQVGPAIVVLGAGAAALRAKCDLAQVQVIENPQWQQGMASSIRAGVGAILTSSVDGVVVMTCDQPAVRVEHLRALTAAPQCLRASSYAGRRGIPAYFPRRLFAELLLLSGDTGARQLLVAADAIELPGGEFDIDTPAALLALQNQSQSMGPG